MTRRFVVLCLSAAALLIAMVAPASAAAPELRGVVSGSPYGASSGYIAVPVLYSKMTARRVGLKSPVGLMVVKRTQRIKVAGAQTTLPVGLRVGDRFKGNAEVTDLNKRIFYPRVTFDEAPSVYFRSKELSLSELTRMIQTLEKNLAALGKFTFDGFALVASQVAGLQAQINDLKGLLGKVSAPAAVDLSGLQTQIDALDKRIDDLLALLANYALKSDLAGFLNAAGVQAMIDAAIAALDIPSDADIQGMIDAAIDALDIPSDADIQGLIDTSIAGLQTDLNDAEADIQALCTAIDDATVTLDPDGGGVLPQITVPVDLGNSVATICP